MDRFIHLGSTSGADSKQPLAAQPPAGVVHRPRRPKMVGVVVAPTQARGVAADHLPAGRQEVGVLRKSVFQACNRHRPVEEIMLGRLAPDLLGGALPGRIVAGWLA